MEWRSWCYSLVYLYALHLPIVAAGSLHGPANPVPRNLWQALPSFAYLAHASHVFSKMTTLTLPPRHAKSELAPLRWSVSCCRAGRHDGVATLRNGRPS